MPRVRFPLFTKIIFLVFLNLLFVGAILLFIFNLDFRFSPRSPFFSESASRIEAVSRLISIELSESTREERDAVLTKYAAAYNLEFYVFDYQGQQIAGNQKAVPAEVLTEMNRFQASLPLNEPPPRSQPNAGDIKNLPPPGQPPLRQPPFFKTSNPTLYWSGSPLMISEKNRDEPLRAFLLIASSSRSGNGMFFDPMPWVVIVGAIAVFSIVFWLPLARGITKSIVKITEATEQIAEEDFDARVGDKRADELGRLGKAINRMAARLSGFVHGQKRFLGDISHELNSPLARLQLALSLIEDEANEKTQPYLEKAKEEVRLMSKLVGELLTYSKAGIKATEAGLETVNLRGLVNGVVERENPAKNAELEIEIGEDLEIKTCPDLLARALANVVRNAIRYAGDAGKIMIAAEEKNDKIVLTVSDNGAGVPDAELGKLFDPFYRVESHRSRDTGGAGLGLAIVKTCVEACRGKVFARNRSAAHGLEIIILLPKTISAKSEI